MKIKNLCRTAFVVTVLLVMSGCGDGGGGGGISSSDYNRVEQENQSLKFQNDKLKKDLEDYKNKAGNLFISTWLAGFSAVALFCVGFACGVKVKKSILANEK